MVKLQNCTAKYYKNCNDTSTKYGYCPDIKAQKTLRGPVMHSPVQRIHLIYLAIKPIKTKKAQL
jgi:hypothetical protein